MEQRCYLWNVWLAWIGIPLLAIVVWWRMGVAAALATFGVCALAQILSIRLFPRLSRALGYGSVADAPADRVPRLTTFDGPVTIYTASLCPFCPIVRQRLAELQQQMHFELRDIDVTFRPDLVRARGLRSVPVIEAGGRFLTGNATTRQLVAFLTEPVVSA